LAVDLYQAVSEDGTLYAQRTNWKKVTFKNFNLVRGFPDTEVDGVSIKPFSRFYRTPQTISLQGQKIERAITLSDSVFITTPQGFVETTALWENGNSFNFSFRAETEGRYIVELISDKGEILFNRAIYVTSTEVLPVMANVQTVVTKNERSAVYDWVNRIREKHKINTLLSATELQAVA